MGKTPDKAGYDDGKAGREPNSAYDNSGVLDRTFEAIATITTGHDFLGEADKADRDYHGGYAAGQADRAKDKD